jgi:hypothetical protein
VESYGDGELTGIKIKVIKDKEKQQEGSGKEKPMRLYETPGMSFMYMDDEYSPDDSMVDKMSKKNEDDQGTSETPAEIET